MNPTTKNEQELDKVVMLAEDLHLSLDSLWKACFHASGEQADYSELQYLILPIKRMADDLDDECKQLASRLGGAA